MWGQGRESSEDIQNLYDPKRRELWDGIQYTTLSTLKTLSLEDGFPHFLKGLASLPVGSKGLGVHAIVDARAPADGYGGQTSEVRSQCWSCRCLPPCLVYNLVTRDLNLDPHASAAGTLPTETSPWLDISMMLPSKLWQSSDLEAS